MADERREGGPGSGVSTPAAPQGTPQDVAGFDRDHSFTLQAIMEMQRSLGELTQAVKTLTDTTKIHGDKIEKISHRVYAAGAVIVVLLGIGTFFLDKIWDTLAAIVKVSGQT